MLTKRNLTDGPMDKKKLTRGKPGSKESSTVPAKDALPTAIDAAERAMNEGAIPAEYRESVRRYFERLK